MDSPRTPLDVELLAKAMHEVADTVPCWNHCEGDNLTLHRKAAHDIAAEYLRLQSTDASLSPEVGERSGEGET